MLSAHERLLYSDRYIGAGPPKTFEEYRYDALGRRVLTRSRNPEYDNNGYIERTVWDGDKVLLEARGYAGQYAVPATLEAWAQRLQTGDSAGSTPGGIVIYCMARGSISRWGSTGCFCVGSPQSGRTRALKRPRDRASSRWPITFSTTHSKS